MAHRHQNAMERTQARCRTLNNTGGLYRERKAGMPADCLTAIKYHTRHIMAARQASEVRTAIFDLAIDLRPLKDDDPRFVHIMTLARKVADYRIAALTT